MLSQDSFKVKGKVMTTLSQGVYQVVLDNGHQVTAFLDKNFKSSVTPFSQGERVTVKLSVFDLSHGRIVSKKI